MVFRNGWVCVCFTRGNNTLLEIYANEIGSKQIGNNLITIENVENQQYPSNLYFLKYLKLEIHPNLDFFCLVPIV